MLLWCAGVRCCRNFYRGVPRRGCLFYCEACPWWFLCLTPSSDCPAYSWFLPASVGSVDTGLDFLTASIVPCCEEWPSYKSLYPITEVDVVAMNILLHLSVRLLYGMTDFFLYVWVRGVVLDERSEVFFFIIGGLTHKNTVLQLFCAWLYLLTQYSSTFIVPFGRPRFERYNCSCSSSNRGSIWGAMAGTAFDDFFFLSLCPGWSSHYGSSWRLRETWRPPSSASS